MSYQINLQAIETRRKALNLSLPEMAKVLGLKSSEQYYRRETGEYQFQAKELPVLASKLGMNLNDFFTSDLEKISS